MGIAQKFNLFKGYLVKYDQPVATMGSSIPLALYLVLLLFIAFSFAIKTKNKKALFYYFCSAVFLITINFTASRAAFLGIGAGVLFFVLFYKIPRQNIFKNKIFWMKVITVLFLAAGITGIILVKDNQNIINKIQKFPFGNIFYRVITTAQTISKTKSLIPDTRISAWQIGLNALKDRPILGYGPENFSIAFDGHYDPDLLKFGKLYWWDRAHNVFLETAINAGILGLAIYVFLIIFVFLKLNQLKKQNPENYLIFLGIQASFIAYFVAAFFSFEIFSTFILFNFILAYICYFLTQNKNNENASYFATEKNYIKYVFLFSCLFLFYFLWQYNLKPFLINKDANWADFYLKKNDCRKAAEKIEKNLANHSIVDNYIRLKYINIVNGTLCIKEQQKMDLLETRAKILGEAVAIRPYYTRSWIFLGNALYILTNQDEKSNLGTDSELRKQARDALIRAKELCPKCQDFLPNIIKNFLGMGEYELAKQETQHCIDLFPDFIECLYLKGLVKIYSNNISEGKKEIGIAFEKGYNLYELNAQKELLKAYIAIKDANKNNTEYFRDVAKIYEEIIGFGERNYQYHASLAFVYKQLGKYAEARKQVMLILTTNPELKNTVEEFLKTLPY